MNNLYVKKKNHILWYSPTFIINFHVQTTDTRYYTITLRSPMKRGLDEMKEWNIHRYRESEREKERETGRLTNWQTDGSQWKDWYKANNIKTKYKIHEKWQSKENRGPLLMHYTDPHWLYLVRWGIQKKMIVIDTSISSFFSWSGGNWIIWVGVWPRGYMKSALESR